MAEPTLETKVVKLTLKENKGSGLQNSLQAEFSGQAEGLYEGQIADSNGEIPISVTLAYIADGAGDVRKIKYRVAGGSEPKKCGSFELRRDKYNLTMLSQNGLPPQHLVQQYSCSIEQFNGNAKIVEQLELLLRAVQKYH